ncbi:hypothetical protein PRZ48_014234 [Zasmidium cellare]|uniref:Uncharacterized protein n=1 Tax=Zasmidium cellare TaxID=395010 RepID=A0ABR0E142_ZASCE|nr:hypothetical protein PRZ48_014234 [Zasmidium cellare]
MATLKLLTAAFAACSLFTTTLALPTGPSDTTPSVLLGNTANTTPPTTCSIQQRDSNDVYGITVPVAYSKETCSKAHEAVASFIVDSGKGWVCEPYGPWTILFFATSKNVADEVNDAMNEVFPNFVFHCANSEVVKVNPLDARESPSALVKRDAVPAHEQSCVAENKGLFNL